MPKIPNNLERELDTLNFFKSAKAFQKEKQVKSQNRHNIALCIITGICVLGLAFFIQHNKRMKEEKESHALALQMQEMQSTSNKLGQAMGEMQGMLKQYNAQADMSSAMDFADKVALQASLEKKVDNFLFTDNGREGLDFFEKHTHEFHKHVTVKASQIILPENEAVNIHAGRNGSYMVEVNVEQQLSNYKTEMKSFDITLKKEQAGWKVDTFQGNYINAHEG